MFAYRKFSNKRWSCLFDLMIWEEAVIKGEAFVSYVSILEEKCDFLKGVISRS